MALAAEATYVTAQRPGGEAQLIVPIPVAASTTIYRGSYVSTSGGYLIPWAGTGARAGIARQTVDNSTGSNGDLTCEVEISQMRFAGMTIAGCLVTSVGADVYCADDDLGNLTLTAGAYEPIGRVVGTPAAGSGDVVLYGMFGASAHDFDGPVVINSTLNVTGAVAFSSTLAVTGACNIDSTIDHDVALVAAGEAYNMGVTINHATASVEGLDLAVAQLTTARTSGTVDGIKVTLTSLAGDTGGTYNGIAISATDGGGTPTHNAIYIAASHDNGLYVADAACVTGARLAGTTRALDAQGKGRFGTHDWGVGATGILLNGTDDDMALIAAARINANIAGAYSAGYNQLAITITQTGDISAFGSWNEL
ncbi:MAG: hypothetical protein ABII82_20105, partial [Verrucomicrobiota bacterium]